MVSVEYDRKSFSGNIFSMFGHLGFLKCRKCLPCIPTTVENVTHQKKIQVDFTFRLQYPNSYSILVASIILRHHCQPLVSKSSTKTLSLHCMLFLVHIPFVTYFITQPNKGQLSKYNLFS